MAGYDGGPLMINRQAMQEANTKLYLAAKSDELNIVHVYGCPHAFLLATVFFQTTTSSAFSCKTLVGRTLKPGSGQAFLPADRWGTDVFWSWMIYVSLLCGWGTSCRRLCAVWLGEAPKPAVGEGTLSLHGQTSSVLHHQSLLLIHFKAAHCSFD